MVIAAVFFWGSNFNAITALDSDIPPIVSSLIRFVIASMVLIAVVPFVERGTTLSVKDYAYLLGLGFVGIFCFNYAIFAGMKETSAVNGALIMASMPLVSVILSKLFLNVKISHYQRVGLLLAICGVFLVITKGDYMALEYNLGDIWIMIACVCGGLYAVLTKTLISHIPSGQATRWTVLFGTVFMFLTSLIQGDINYDYASISLSSYALLGYMGILGTVLAYYFWITGCQVLGPEKTSVTTNMIPLFTLVISFILGQEIETIQLIGTAIILLGVLFGSGYMNTFRPSSSSTSNVKSN